MSFNANISNDSNSSVPLRLTSRRGSLSAPDPFAQNVNLDTPRGITSRLTIMRVPSSPEGHTAGMGHSPWENTITLQEPAMPAHSAVSTSNIGRSSGWGHARVNSDDSAERKERMSFAASSFSPIFKSGSAESRFTPYTPSSTSQSPPHTLIGSSAAKSRTYSNPTPSTTGSPAISRRPSLTPQQVCDLARISLSQAANGSDSDITSPHSEAHPSFKPLSSPLRHATPSDPALSRTLDLHSVSPTPFNPLPASHYLPFIDRPSEVAALLSTEPNKRLMLLLKQTFPSYLRNATLSMDEQDPIKWSYPTLLSFITDSPRSKSSDETWVSKARRCIRAHSEVVWERLKNVLGVPPELDTDEPAHTATGEEIVGNDLPEMPEEFGEAWVEPISPTTSPLSTWSPGFTSVSPIDIEDAGFGFGGRENGMETIGEGEEEDHAPTNADISHANSLVGDHATSANDSKSSDAIRALRLCTRLSSFSAYGLPGRSAVPDSTGVKLSPRSFSFGHPERDSLRFSDGIHRSSSLGHVRRPSAGRPEFERGPGNPLFPSNFGRLSVGPTLAANNPTLRRQLTAFPSAFSMPRPSTHTALEPLAPHPEDRLHTATSTGSDYALTVASESDTGSGATDTKRPHR